jgi:hypothetical protein
MHEEKENEPKLTPSVTHQDVQEDATREEVESEDYIPITRQIVPNTDE